MIDVGLIEIGVYLHVQEMNSTRKEGKAALM